MVPRRHRLAVLLLALTPTFAAVASSPPAAADAAEATVDRLLAQLTEPEKLSLLAGVDGFFVPGVERLGLPRLKMGDGPVGVRNWGESTLYPATILLAATWSEDLAARFGDSLGRDSRARGMHLSLAPGVNIYRSPLNGRNYEYLGEDPFLASRLAVASIRAVQSRGVAATVKHFAANNAETRRSYISNEVDERTLREIYLPAFRAAVTEAHVGAVMNAYNLLNGQYCTAHSWLTNQLLKTEWGFDGIVMSDWNATHDTLGAARGGLDLEMPGANYFAPARLTPLLRSGELAPALIDEKVRRLLRLMVRYGWIGREQLDASIPLDDPTSAATALALARAGITLLKNDGSMLPLDSARLKRVAVLGPNAFSVATGLGSGRVRPFHSVTMAQGLRDLLGAERVVEVPWVEPLQFLERSAYTDLRLELFGGRKQRTPRVVSHPDRIELSWDKRNPGDILTARDLAFARWTGAFEAPPSGDCQFVVQAKDANVQIWIDDALCWDSVREGTGSFTRRLAPGRHALRVEIEQRKKDFSFTARVGWGETQPVIPVEFADAVASADAVLVGAGFNVISGEGEGYDRSYALPGRQEDLIRAAAALNPRTIVALNAGGAVATAGWIDRTPAVLHTFYSGQEGGTALAEILLGRTNPSGHLPFSYERRWEDCAAFANFPGHHTDESVTKVRYAEGVFVGYRWFDAKDIAPLFPFGHGLSYTSFAFTDLRLQPRGDDLLVSFNLTNTGERAGAQVAQLYVGQRAPGVPRPPRELKGFARVELAPGETQRVQLTLSPSAFAYFHPERRRWQADAGGFVIEVGSSSRDLPLRTVFTREKSP